MPDIDFSGFISYIKKSGLGVALGKSILDSSFYRPVNRIDVFINKKPIGSIYQTGFGGSGSVYFEGQLPPDVHPPEMKGMDIRLSYSYDEKGGARTDKWENIPFP